MLPLKNITVVSLEQAVAAPFTTRQLADWGARVIKIERPTTGDFARYYDDSVHGLSSHFVWLNRGKESLTLDLTQHQGQEILHQLLKQADVFVQNLKPGAADKLGIGSAALHAQYPRLICCDISGFGSDGPLRDRKAYDLLIQAESGLLSITGTADQPVKVGVSIADIAAGMYGLTAILTALLSRTQHGQGTIVEVSMLEALGEWMGYPLYYSHYSGHSPARTGSAHATIAPYGPFPVKDGTVVYFGIQNDREWSHFCEAVLDRPEWVSDPRFRDNSARVTHHDALDAQIRDCFSSLTQNEVVQRLEQAEIAYAQLNTMEQMWNHPQLRSRHRWSMVDTENGPIEALVPPFSVGGVIPSMGAVPALGEHTDTVLKELGYSAEAIAQLRRLTVI